MVQYRGVRVSVSGNVWECGQEYRGGTGISECEHVVGEEYETHRARKSSIPRRGVQFLQSSELQPAGQLPRLADLRTDHISTRSAAHSVWVEAFVLATAT